MRQKKDVMMTLLCAWSYMHGWFKQDYFKELTDQDVRKRLYDEQKNQIRTRYGTIWFYCLMELDEDQFVDAQRVIVGL